MLYPALLGIFSILKTLPLTNISPTYPYPSPNPNLTLTLTLTLT